MKKLPFKGIAYAVGCAAVITACGGGTDDEAGAPAPLSVIPNTIRVEAAASSNCPEILTLAGASAPVGRYYINGGAAPFRVDSTSQRVHVSTNHVNHRGEFFQLYFTGGCVVPANVIVRDSMNEIVVLEATYTDKTQ